MHKALSTGVASIDAGEIPAKVTIHWRKIARKVGIATCTVSVVWLLLHAGAWMSGGDMMAWYWPAITIPAVAVIECVKSLLRIAWLRWRIARLRRIGRADLVHDGDIA